ncbi:hypothetical protein Lalb_Chr23g0271111 [Lupinus albus]|uniref:Uncharacterized protein n=1 Tax=Lupinus albus TaxID=3870 RepID=A0A6A4NKM7_LUPAL|nr:hypothetical protein Lalb_Chr23g0271111 [Lupinus albus]
MSKMNFFVKFGSVKTGASIIVRFNCWKAALAVESQWKLSFFKRFVNGDAIAAYPLINRR